MAFKELENPLYIQSMKAAIFILTQNNEVRKTYLKTTLYFLFRNFNAKFKYPIVILHEGDYDDKAQKEILMGVRITCRHLLSFQTLDKDDFVVPDHVDKERMTKCIAAKPVPYWRNDTYRLMCRWWMVHFPKYAKKYDYVMRIDDDSIIEEPIDHDLFTWMVDKNLVYSSNFVHIDCGICNYGMKEFFQSRFPEKTELINNLFVPSEIAPNTGEVYNKIKSLLAINGVEVGSTESIKTWMPSMYYNNFFITKTDFWMREDVQKTIEAIDKESGGLYYYRWGDAPLQSLIVFLCTDQSQVKRAVFKYSKRLQREAFKDDEGSLESYMPATYDKTSCMVQDAN